MKSTVKIIIIGLIVLIFIFAVYFSVILEDSEGTEDHSISGQVTPAQEGIKVVAVKDLEFVGETVTDETGTYSIDNLEEHGPYGLLFTHEGWVYIYNDAVNIEWIAELPNGAHFLGIKETVDTSFPANIDLSREKADYTAEQIIVQIKTTTSESEIEEMVNGCPCTVIEKVIKPYGHFYVIKFPHPVTIFDINSHFIYYENYVVTSFPNVQVTENSTMLDEIKSPSLLSLKKFLD